jgi:amino acid transporter
VSSESPPAFYLLLRGDHKARSNAYYTQSLGSKCKFNLIFVFLNYHSALMSRADWDNPYSFFNPVYSVADENGNIQRTIAGTAGVFLGMW